MLRFSLPSLLLMSVLFLLPLSATADDLAVSHGLAEAIERDGVAPVVITLDLSAPRGDADHPAAKTDVHPAVFDLVMMSSGEVTRFEPAGDFHLLHILATRDALARIFAMDEVVDVQLGEALDADKPAVPTKAVCPSSSTRACLLTNWGVTSSYNGSTATVGAISSQTTASQSATFWVSSSSNWEVLAKIVKGCAVNNQWWLFAGAAGDRTYSVSVRIFLSGGSLGLGTFTANQTSIINTSLFSCS